MVGDDWHPPPREPWLQELFRDRGDTETLSVHQRPDTEPAAFELFDPNSGSVREAFTRFNVGDARVAYKRQKGVLRTWLVAGDGTVLAYFVPTESERPWLSSVLLRFQHSLGTRDVDFEVMLGPDERRAILTTSVGKASTGSAEAFVLRGSSDAYLLANEESSEWRRVELRVHGEILVAAQIDYYSAAGEWSRGSLWRDRSRNVVGEFGGAVRFSADVPSAIVAVCVILAFRKWATTPPPHGEWEEVDTSSHGGAGAADTSGKLDNHGSYAIAAALAR